MPHNICVLRRQQAERLTEHLTGILCVQKEKFGEQFVSKAMLEKAWQEGHCHDSLMLWHVLPWLGS